MDNTYNLSKASRPPHEMSQFCAWQNSKSGPYNKHIKVNKNRNKKQQEYKISNELRVDNPKWRWWKYWALPKIQKNGFFCPTSNKVEKQFIKSPRTEGGDFPGRGGDFLGWCLPVATKQTTKAPDDYASCVVASFLTK